MDKGNEPMNRNKVQKLFNILENGSTCYLKNTNKIVFTH